MSDPDTVEVLYRPWKKEEKFIMGETTVGSKKTKVVMTDGDSTKEEEVGVAEAGSLCLSSEMALRLARLGVELEQRFGGPRDVEFALAKDSIYLLQSRPITSFHGWTDRDLLHEYDAGCESKDNVYTKGNVGYVFLRHLFSLM